MTAFAEIDGSKFVTRQIGRLDPPDFVGPDDPTPQVEPGMTCRKLAADLDRNAPTLTSRLQWLDTDPAPVWVETATLDAIKATMWERIKDKRDTIKRGGVKVAVSAVDYWFHSDDSSRIQQLGLVMMGANVPAVQWKTMSGAFVTMTQALANSIFNAVASLDQSAFGNAEQHRAAMEASGTPSSYDYSTGWPQVYADTLTP